MKSLPTIARLEYLDIALAVLRSRELASVDDVRIAIGRAVEEMALRGEARQTRDWKHPLAYRDTTVDCLRELMNWNFVQGTPLADTADTFERIRNLPVRLTPEGIQVAELGAAERREVFAQRLLVRYPLFLRLMEHLERNDILIPELSDAAIKSCFRDAAVVVDDQDGWDRVASHCEQAFRESTQMSMRLLPPPSRAKFREDIGKYLRRRFLTKPPKTMKEVTGATNKAIAHAVLRGAGFRGDWNAYDRCLRWTRDLYLGNDARHVLNVCGWLAWSASKVRWADGKAKIERRGVTQYREQVRAAIVNAYDQIAETHRTTGVQVPLIPIYQVRETAAFACRVCDEVVDRILGEMVTKRGDGDVVVELHLGDLRDFVPSARPFRLNSQRYFYLSIYSPSEPAKGVSDDRG